MAVRIEESEVILEYAQEEVVLQVEAESEIEGLCRTLQRWFFYVGNSILSCCCV
jgi:hypothetical protein